MATITLKGQPCHTTGELPAVGSTAPDFQLTSNDLAEVRIETFVGKKKLISIVPSLDTGVCAISAKRFNREVSNRGDTALINISADLPFAQKRFCDSETLAHITNLSTFRSSTFGTDYGVQLLDGPLVGLMSRAVLVLDVDNKIVHAEHVPEIAQEPNYDAAMNALNGLSPA